MAGNISIVFLMHKTNTIDYSYGIDDYKTLLGDCCPIFLLILLWLIL